MGCPAIGKAELEAGLSVPVSAAWLGGGGVGVWKFSSELSSISSPEKEKLNVDIL